MGGGRSAEIKQINLQLAVLRCITLAFGDSHLERSPIVALQSSLHSGVRGFKLICREIAIIIIQIVNAP